MKTLRRPAILLSLSAVFSTIALANSYTFITIDVPGSTSTWARGINNSGEIVGTYTQANSTRGFLYVDGSFSTIDVPGAVETQALAIDDQGQIVGTFTDARGEHGFLFLAGTFTTIDAPRATSTSATGIDSAGEIIGTYTDTNYQMHGFRYSGNAFSSLEAAFGEQTLAVGINDAGQVVNSRAMRSTIEMPGAQGRTYPAAIDNAGEIVGFYVDAGGTAHGFLATPASQSSLEAGSTPTSSVTETHAGSATAIGGNLTAKVSSNAGVCDVNGNGVINVSDVQSIINQALGKASAASDLNSDHVVNVVDIQVVMNAVLKLGCTPIAGQQGGGGAVTLLTVQSGNGQVLCVLPSCTLQSWQPLSVKATNASGNPVAGATVSWNVTTGAITLGGPTSTTSVTDSNGIATQALSETIFVWTANPFSSYNVNTIRATSNNVSVTFTVTQALEDPSSGSSEMEPEPPQFNGGSIGTLTGVMGSTGTIPIQEQVAGIDQASQGVPNIAIRLINQQTSPTLTCATAPNADPGSVLTDARGNASCYPIFSGTGTGTYYISIGGVAGGTVGNGAMYFAALGPLFFTSTSSAGGGGGTGTEVVQIISGNNQSVPVNNALSPLIVKLVDALGNVLIGQTMIWSVSPAFAATLPNGTLQTDSNGEIALTGVTLSSPCASGCSITIAVQSSPSVSATFQETLK